MFGAGYREHFSLEDDLITAAHLRKASAGGTNRFNDVDIGLYIGHASAGKQAETATGLFVPQAYIPIYNSAANSWDWVRTTDSEFGSERLKWMHLLVCNYFRASPYRSDAIFDGLRNSGALPINTDLHVLSSMASEVWLSVRFGELWVKALMGEFGPGNSSVVDAWGYAVRRSQRWRDYVGSGFEWNVARSIYWPECRNDRIYGFGQQTTPDPNNVQAGLEFHDTTGAPW